MVPESFKLVDESLVSSKGSGVLESIQCSDVCDCELFSYKPCRHKLTYFAHFSRSAMWADTVESSIWSWLACSAPLTWF